MVKAYNGGTMPGTVARVGMVLAARGRPQGRGLAMGTGRSRRSVRWHHATRVVGLEKGLRGRFGMYTPPLLEAPGLAEVEHHPRGNRIRAK